MWFVAFRHLGPMNEPAFANMLLLVGYLRGSLMAWSIHISPHFFQLKATTYVNPRLRLAKKFTVSGHVEASWADADPCGHFLILLFLCDWIQRNLESFFWLPNWTQLIRKLSIVVLFSSIRFILDMFPSTATELTIGVRIGVGIAEMTWFNFSIYPLFEFHHWF
jgi:hypothetical protein